MRKKSQLVCSTQIQSDGSLHLPWSRMSQVTEPGHCSHRSPFLWKEQVQGNNFPKIENNIIFPNFHYLLWIVRSLSLELDFPNHVSWDNDPLVLVHEETRIPTWLLPASKMLHEKLQITHNLFQFAKKKKSRSWKWVPQWDKSLKFFHWIWRPFVLFLFLGPFFLKKRQQQKKQLHSTYVFCAYRFYFKVKLVSENWSSCSRRLFIVDMFRFYLHHWANRGKLYSFFSGPTQWLTGDVAT